MMMMMMMMMTLKKRPRFVDLDDGSACRGNIRALHEEQPREAAAVVVELLLLNSFCLYFDVPERGKGRRRARSDGRRACGK